MLYLLVCWHELTHDGSRLPSKASWDVWRRFGQNDGSLAFTKQTWPKRCRKVATRPLMFWYKDPSHFSRQGQKLYMQIIELLGCHWTCPAWADGALAVPVAWANHQMQRYNPLHQNISSKYPNITGRHHQILQNQCRNDLLIFFTEDLAGSKTLL